LRSKYPAKKFQKKSKTLYKLQHRFSREVQACVHEKYMTIALEV
jgi:hypothetical protein